MANPFGDVPAGGSENPFGDVAASAAEKTNPFGDAPAQTASVGETLASLPERGWKGLVSGTTTTGAAFDWAQTAGFSPEQVATFEMYPESPAAKEYFARKAEAEQSIRTAKLMQGELKAARPQAPGKFDEIVGGAVESLGASVIPTVALGAINPGLGAVAGLATNFAMEAGGQWDEAMSKGAAPETVTRSMGFGGAVSTMLELPVIGQMKKMMEAGKPTLKAVAKAAGELVGKEAVQEGATQLAMDTEANISGWGGYGLGEMAGRAGMAAAQGAVMGGVMGGAARTLSKAKEANMEAIQEKALTEVVAKELAVAGGLDQGQTEQIVGAVIKDLKTRQIDPEQAALQREQLSGELANLPATEFGAGTGATLDAAFIEAKAQGVLRTDTEGTAKDIGIAGEDVEARRVRYAEEHLAGNELPIGDRIIYAGSSPDAVGLMLKQIDNLPDGSVTVLGGNLQSTAALFPGLMPEAVGEAIQKLAQAANITAPIIVTLEQLEGGQTGMHKAITLPDGRMAHLINPRELPSAKAKYGFGNRTTIAEFVGTLTHEFGHAVEREKFMQGIARQAAAAGRDLATPINIIGAIDSFAVTPEIVADLRSYAPIEADLLETWNNLQTAARQGTMSGKDFANAWLGPRKFSWSFENKKGTQDIYTWIHAMARKAKINKSIDNMTPAEVIQAVMGTTGKEDAFLSFTEFMAEQYSRAAQDRNYLKGTRMGTWFQSVLNSLRQFFASNKDQGFIKPHVTFERWLDEATARDKATKKPRKWGHIKLSKQIQAEQKKLKARLEIERAQLAIDGEQELETDVSDEAPEPDLAPDEEAAKDATTVEGITTMLETAIDMGAIKKNSKEHKAILGLIAMGQLEQASDIVWQAVMKGVNFDRGPAVNEGIISTEDVAGLTAEEMANPGVVAYAKKLWQEMKFDSPFFKRWNGKNTLVDAITGEPIVLYHGSGNAIPFFDPTLLGSTTGAQGARKGFFLTANPANALVYANSPIHRTTRYLTNESDQRKAQALRRKIQHYDEVLAEAAKNNGQITLADGTKQKLDARLWRSRRIAVERELTIHMELAPGGAGKPTVGAFYVRMENPLVFDFAGREWERGSMIETIKQALMLGHDGVIFKQARDPMLDDIYVVFTPEQIKSTDNVGSFGEHDKVAFDRGNPQEAAMRLLGKGVDAVAPGSTLGRATMNLIARISDSLVQLQQRAAKPLVSGELDLPMQAMLRALQKGEAFKNTLQQSAEVLVKELRKRSQKELDAMYTFLEMEWKSGQLLYDLQGWTGGPEMAERELIWGNLEDGGRDVSSVTGKNVTHWEFGPPADPKALEKLGALLRKAGIDTGTQRGEELHQLIVQIKNTQLAQFTSLQNVLERKIATRWASNPAVATMELEKLYQSMQKIRLTPFFPQGKYGNFVITVQEPNPEAKKGERKWKTVRVEYYESQAEMETALKGWNAKSAGRKIDWKKLDDYQGLPLTLPRNLLESLEQTQLFSKEQLDTMSTLMVSAGHEKLVVRYGKQSELVDGGERDLARNYSNFMWHNANFIWKLDFRTEFTKAINAHRAELRRAQRDISPEGIALAKELQRNHDIMNRVKDYVLYPPYEFQGIRSAAALVYLAYNVKTALMNLGTMLNSYAAITTEYGERVGHMAFAKGLWDAGRLAFGFQKSLMTKHIVGEISAQDSPLVWMYNKAVAEGVLDQSYAFFLAGQSNTPTALRGMKNGVAGKLGYHAMEFGMFPFRMVEKANRLGTLTMFFEAERGRGAGLEEAYAAAVQRTNLLQNAYDAGNRSELFRGKKALLTMFASYSQFMVWNMAGGYSKALRADVQARQGANELVKIESILGSGGYTAKLWLMYMLLGGLLAPPFAENVVEFLSWIWRKVYKTNLRMEMRQFINELGMDANLVMHGMLGGVGGMDLSGSFSMGRVIPGVDLLNRDMKDFQQVVGALAVKGAGPFGGFTEDLFKFLEASTMYMQGKGRATEALAELPGAIGSVGKAVDATILQGLRPTGAVLDKAGARVVEDPPGSGNFRDLTEWEIVYMLLGANPAVLSRSREMNYMEAGEQIYWRTRKQSLMDNRNEAILTNDEKRLEKADELIQKFNDDLPEKYQDFAITGKMKAQSLKAKRKTIEAREEGKGPRSMRSILGDVHTAWGGSATP